MSALATALRSRATLTAPAGSGEVGSGGDVARAEDEVGLAGEAVGEALAHVAEAEDCEWSFVVLHSGCDCDDLYLVRWRLRLELPHSAFHNCITVSNGMHAHQSRNLCRRRARRQLCRGGAPAGRVAGHGRPPHPGAGGALRRAADRADDAGAAADRAGRKLSLRRRETVLDAVGRARRPDRAASRGSSPAASRSPDRRRSASTGWRRSLPHSAQPIRR